jgi:hypothetical protein
LEVKTSIYELCVGRGRVKIHPVTLGLEIFGGGEVVRSFTGEGEGRERGKKKKMKGRRRWREGRERDRKSRKEDSCFP